MRVRRSTRTRAVLLFALALAAGLAAVYWRVFLGWMIADRDAGRIFFPDSAFLLRCLRAGELPLWQPHALLGTPFAASLQAQVFYPPRVLAVLAFGPHWSVTALQIAHAALAAVGTFRLARALGRSAEAAALAAAAFALGPVVTDLSTTPNLVHAAAWAPWMLLAARRGSAAGLAVATALASLAGSPEMVLWELALVALAAGRWTSWRGAGRLALGVTWGICLAAAALVPAAEQALESVRGTARVDPLDWSASPRQLLAMAWPLADTPRGPYWGEDQWLLLQLFAGTVVVLLAVIGARRARQARAFAWGVVLFSVLALGRHFPPSAWLLSAPPLNAFRYPAKYLVGALFALAVLAAFGVDALAARARRRGRRVPVRGALLAVAVLELALFHALQVGHGWAPAEAVTRPAAFAAQMDRDAARISVSLGRRADAEGVEVVLSREPSPALLDARQTFTPNRFAEDGVRALEGYGAPEPARAFDFQLSGRRAVADLAGVRHYLRPGPAPFPDLRAVAALPGELMVYASETAFPRAWVVSRAAVAGDQEVLAALERGSLPFREQALLADGPELDAPDCPAAAARVMAERCDALELEATACEGGGVLVVGDAHAPGWTATVDGARAAVLRADLALRAVHVPAGTHQVRMTYAPRSQWAGLLVTAASLTLFPLFAALALRKRARPPPSSHEGTLKFTGAGPGPLTQERPRA